MKKYAVIVAGGSGTRMKSSVPKQFMLVHDKPVLWYSLECFLRAFGDLKIILVIPKEFEKEAQTVTSQTSAPSRIERVYGGVTRFDSVKQGLAKTEGTSIIFVHDAVRCMVSQDLIQRCYWQAMAKGSAIPAIPLTDSVRLMEGETTKPLDRSRLLAVQTPQTFRSEIILPAFQQEYKAEFTDEATVAEAAGFEVYMIEGESENIKITLPVDLVIAAHLLGKKSWDIH